MGLVHSFCCKDVAPEANEEGVEEHSRIWTQTSNDHIQYGACNPPTPQIIFKIVLPKLTPIEIDTSAINLNCSNSSGIANSPYIPNMQKSFESSTETDSNQSNHHNQSMEPSETNNETSLEETSSSTTQQQQQPALIKEEYCPEKFEHLRSFLLKSQEDQRRFRELLWSCIPWAAPGGKSGSTFLKTINDQFILKEMSKLELQSFLSIADEYFKYIEDAYHEDKPSLLSTILGIYRIVYKNSVTQHSSEYYFMVMGNLFYQRHISQRYDLKGSVRNRLVDTDDPDNTEHVLMDENLLRITCENPLLIHARSKRILNQAIDNDSKFLTSISVMDYSLLVGIDKEKHELILGIIDYVRPFTWDKKIERVVKSVVSTELPTIIEPELYRERFCEAMDKYFESVPDNW